MSVTITNDEPIGPMNRDSHLPVRQQWASVEALKRILGGDKWGFTVVTSGNPLLKELGVFRGIALFKSIVTFYQSESHVR